MAHTWLSLPLRLEVGSPELGRLEVAAKPDFNFLKPLKHPSATHFAVGRLPAPIPWRRRGDGPQVLARGPEFFAAASPFSLAPKLHPLLPLAIVGSGSLPLPDTEAQEPERFPLMVGLGNGRRNARSTPLFFLMLTLVACLAFFLSYWVSSSRGAELQARIVALDAKLRREDARSRTAELEKYQLQVQLQNQLESQQKMIGELEQMQQQQIQSEARVCNDDKEHLKRNITSSTKIIQTLQEQFQQLQKDYGAINQKLQEMQKKLTYDITQCSNQINDQKELYEEQIKKLNKRLADAIKSQAENRSTEATKQTKLLQKDPSDDKSQFSEGSNLTNKSDVKSNEVVNSTKFVSELQSSKLASTGSLEDVNRIVVNNEKDAGENNHGDALNQKNTDQSRNADNQATESHNKEV
ncbi:Golgi membrane protein 1-like [Narcine bancroftii]|uniref:Golgi membrane protein 1-like n=1 Tax=Narcine bancroftii TaxID=1343680 RepID=UPI0038315B58